MTTTTEPAEVPADIAAAAQNMSLSKVSLLASPRQLSILAFYANAVAKSGFGHKNPQKNFAIFLKGLEVGIPPLEALESIIAGDDGKMSLSASLMHANLLKSGKGRVEFIERTAERVTARFVRFDDKDNPLEITWSMNEEAEDAGLSNRATYKKYPRQLLTARVLSEGISLKFPDIDTARSYTPDEIGLPDDAAELANIKFEDATPDRFRTATAAPAPTATASQPQGAATNAPASEQKPTEPTKATTSQAATQATPQQPIDQIATIQTLVQWAGLSREEWHAILKPYGVVSAKQLPPDQLKNLTQSLFDRYTPFELRAAGLNLTQVKAAGFTIGTDEADEGKPADAHKAASSSTANSSSNASAPLAA